MATRSLGQLTLDLIARIGGYTAPMDQASRKSKKTAKDIEDSAKDASVAWKNLGGVVAGAFSSITVGSIAAKFITETKAAEVEQAQLAAVLESTGKAAGYTQSQLNDMADSMEAVTRFSGGEFTEAQTALLAFTGIAGEEFPRALAAAADMAERTGVTVKQASETIGRALDVPSKGMAALSKQGFRFTEDQKKLVKELESTGRAAEAQGLILTELEKTYGGAAAAARNTFAGSLDGLRNTIDGLLTSDGGLPGIAAAVNSISDALASDTAAKGFKFIGDAALVLTGIIGSRLVSSVVASAAAFTAAQIEAARYQAVLARMAGVSATAAASQTALAGAARASSAAMALVGGPVGVAVLAGAGLVYLATKSSDAEERLQKLREKAEGAAQGIAKMGEANRVVASSQITKEITETEKQLAELQKFVADADAGRAFTSLEYYQQVQADIENLQGHITDLNKDLVELQRNSSASVVGSSTPFAEYNNPDIEKSINEQINERIKIKQEEYAETEKLAKAVNDQADAYRRQLALTGEVTELERVRYEIANGMYKGIQADQEKVLEGLAKQVDEQNKLIENERRLKDLRKEFSGIHEQALESSGKLIDLENYRSEKQREALQKEMDELKAKGAWTAEIEAEAQKALEEQEQAHQDRIKQIRDQAEADELKRKQIQLAGAESLFGALGDLTEAFGEKNSRLRKAFLIAEKAAAIASATIAIQKGIAEASSLGFPQNLVAMGTVAAQTAGILTTIKGVNIAHGGLDFVPKETTYLLDKGERVVSPKQNTDLTNFLANAKTNSGMRVEVINTMAGTPINVHGDMQEDGTLRLVITAVEQKLMDDLGKGRGVWAAGQRRYGWATKGAF